MANWLLDFPDRETFRILYLAQYAPCGPAFQEVVYPIDGGYPAYHYHVFSELRALGFQVYSSPSPTSLYTGCGNVDYVYSLLNRMPIRDSEIFVSSFCEYLSLPYLGAPPAVRALAEDKFLFKLFLRGLGIETPAGFVCRADEPERPSPTFSAPFFIKDRKGAASEGISRRNLADTWDAALCGLTELLGCGKDALVEQFCSGVDVTVPVVGANPYKILGYVHPRSDEEGSILTHRLKLDDPLGYELISLPRQTQRTIGSHVAAIWEAVGPIDYFRLDYRYDPKTNALNLLEMNICCHLDEGSSIDLAASNLGVGFRDLLVHVIRYSQLRQSMSREKIQWVL